MPRSRRRLPVPPAPPLPLTRAQASGMRQVPRGFRSTSSGGYSNSTAFRRAMNAAAPVSSTNTGTSLIGSYEQLIPPPLTDEGKKFMRRARGGAGSTPRPAGAPSTRRDRTPPPRRRRLPKRPTPSG
jgi:hypothetical protein